MTVTQDDRPGTSTDPGGADRRVGELVAGRYRLIERLGAGAMGTVYLARHEALQRQVAMKFLQEELAGNREIAARFAREAMAAARLQHRNVSTVYDSGTDDEGRCFLAMEYVHGDLLRGARPTVAWRRCGPSRASRRASTRRSGGCWRPPARAPAGRSAPSSRPSGARATPARCPRCGFLGLGTCNECLGSAVPSAIRAIEARAADAGGGRAP
jgi:hypothetical protein